MEQSYTKHTKIDPLFHYVLAPLSLVTVILGVIQFIQALINNSFTLNSYILLFSGIVLFFIVVKVRLYALKLQDRLIRTEESFRYYILTGKRLDPRLTLKQLIALRFASDEEYSLLVEKTVSKNLSAEQIKLEVQNWKADFHRV
ncbi:DUF6526 family protein [Metabacillus bambusae]|uniref:ABC transporter permease n=1 Tax=Metabacillus bambusae TaxID=2795218 RepID=A0ABS3N1S4_9BACI|nr:DUF6526 family protein [Metabacillus bambusae]MBO1512021.1 hypothetical protein [Metabacillus bambusae]